MRDLEKYYGRGDQFVAMGLDMGLLMKAANDQNR